jgi:hypothetical protein
MKDKRKSDESTTATGEKSEGITDGESPPLAASAKSIALSI